MLSPRSRCFDAVPVPRALPKGATSCKAANLDCVYAFIAPPSLEELESRLRGRGTETDDKARAGAGRARARAATAAARPRLSAPRPALAPRTCAQITLRLANARKELEKKDESGFFDIVIGAPGAR